jgi:hypothetical protein
MNEADDSYHEYAWQHQLNCGHKTKSQTVGLNGPLTQLAFPILTIGQSALCEECNDMKKIKRLVLWEVEDSPEIT